MNRFFLKRIVTIAIFAALSTILYFFPKFSLGFVFPDFLKIQFSALPVIILAFAYGPVDAIIVLLIRLVIKVPTSSSMGIGEIVDLLVGLGYILPATLYYQKSHNRKGALIAILLGVCGWLIMSVLTNWLITVPAYIAIYFGGNTNAFIGACSIIPGINSSNYMIRYLLFAVAPFNLVLSSIISLVVYFVYKRISTFLPKRNNNEKAI